MYLEELTGSITLENLEVECKARLDSSRSRTCCFFVCGLRLICSIVFRSIISSPTEIHTTVYPSDTSASNARLKFASFTRI